MLDYTPPEFRDSASETTEGLLSEKSEHKVVKKFNQRRTKKEKKEETQQKAATADTMIETETETDNEGKSQTDVDCKKQNIVMPKIRSSKLVQEQKRRDKCPNIEDIGHARKIIGEMQEVIGW
ncbi:hypothetical protein JTB14_025546 [Gonioctena quinquepunctata]|nr:hypothetical protein JTB14_025546 [Gonioctena quinquepunctata]